MFDLYLEFRRLIAALDEGQIDYAVCGGLAMAVYNRPRATVDIDVLILSESLEPVMGIATKLSYQIRGLDKTFSNGAIEIRRISKIDPDSGHVLSLDLLLVTPAIQRIWNSRVEADWEDGTLSIVSRGGLIELKRLRASPQDIADIAALEEDIDHATN
jgi:hypothetical protein